MADEKTVIMEGQESFSGVKKDNTKTDIQDVEKALADAVENERMQDEEDKNSVKDINGIRYHESHIDRRTVRSILKKYADHEIVIPATQRFYVWKQKQRDGLLDSIKKGLPCGSITLCTLENGDGTTYLIDGLQRITSLLIMSNDKSLTDDERSKVNNYQVAMEIVYNMTLEEMSDYFVKKNSGIAVSAATKSNASLPKNIQEVGLKLSRNKFFLDIKEKANSTFSKNEHNKIIAWNTLLACAGVKVDSLKSSDITERLKTYESDVMANADSAVTMIDRLANIYNSITDDKYIKRSMNANFISILVYVLYDYKNITNEQVVTGIETIFAKGKAISEYSITTGANSASKEKSISRYNVLVKLLNNPTKVEAHKEKASKTKESNFVTFESKPSEPSVAVNDEAYHKFCQSYTGKILNTHSNDYPIEFNDMNNDERRMLYTFCEVKPNDNQRDGVIMKAFNRVEKIKPDKKEFA
jgi:hypothetical protein